MVSSGKQFLGNFFSSFFADIPCGACGGAGTRGVPLGFARGRLFDCTSHWLRQCLASLGWQVLKWISRGGWSGWFGIEGKIKVKRNG